jgi:SAM-dependent methyltransferase
MRLKHYEGELTDNAFWSKYWERVRPLWLLGETLSSPLRKFMLRYLPKGELILEGGCGVGQWVEALRREGYSIEGVDGNADALKRAEETFPDSRFRRSDLLNLDVSDNHYGGYISLGVMEHFEEGMDAPLAEAMRVLKPGGTLLITVPYFSPWLKRNKYQTDGDARTLRHGNGEFQYYFLDEAELKSAICTAGFRVDFTDYLFPMQGLRAASPLFVKLYGFVTHRRLKAHGFLSSVKQILKDPLLFVRHIGFRFISWVGELSWVRVNAAGMIMMIAVKDAHH